MIRHRYLNGLSVLLIILSLVFTLILLVRNESLPEGGMGEAPEYTTKVFGGDVLSLEIQAEDAAWQQMLQNPMSEEYICVDVVVNGTKFSKVGIRPKGNSSLSKVASSESDRYSFRLKFDQYIKGQTCFGLDSFVVNNLIDDSTYMKEYLSYTLMQEAGVVTPCISYADISVNGENWGLYLAVEAYQDSFETRVFGDTKGMLYNVKSMDIGAGKEGEGNAPMPMPEGATRNRPSADETATPAFAETTKDNAQRIEENPNVEADTRMPAGRGDKGGSLVYTDDKVDSYPAIFDNLVGQGGEEDFKRVIQAIQALSSGEDLERYFDVDQTLRYLAVHTLVVNLDSYSSSMAQNYFLYERDGQVTVLPWDYNLAWGGFQSSSTESVINFPIDTPVSGVELSQRPLIAVLLANEEYLNRYHSYLQQLVKECVQNGAWENRIAHLNQVISPYVAKDSTAFYSYEQYEAAVSALQNLGQLRAESVQGQLDGTIPSTTEGQKADPAALILSDGLSLATMGSMDGGRGGMDNRPERDPNQGVPPALEAGNFAKPEQKDVNWPDDARSWGQEESEVVPWRSLVACASILFVATGLAMCWKRRY